MKCSVCKCLVRDGVVEDGRARHAGCGRDRNQRQCLSLPRSAVETFKRLGKGNVSEGGRIAAKMAEETGA